MSLPGPPILAATFNVTQELPTSALLCSTVIMVITACATASHIIKDDPFSAVAFCGSIFTLSVLFTFSYASTLRFSDGKVS